jgi:hypothetical protein
MIGHPLLKLPALIAATPRRFSSSLSARMRFSAPRSLKLAVNCRLSNFSHTSQPAIPDRVREWARAPAPAQ